MSAAIAAPEDTDWAKPEGVTRDYVRQTPEHMAGKTLAEKRSLNERTRLSWNPNKVPLRGQGKFVGGTENAKGEHQGGVCLSLPYTLVDRKYYIQNCRVFKTNGDEVTLEQVFEWENGSPLYLRVKEALVNYLSQAVEHDAQLCKHCRTFRAETMEGLMQHTFEQHPEIVAKMAGISIPEPVSTPAPTQANHCVPCNKSFKNAGGLNLHRFKKHDIAA